MSFGLTKPPVSRSDPFDACTFSFAQLSFVRYGSGHIRMTSYNYWEITLADVNKLVESTPQTRKKQWFAKVIHSFAHIAQLTSPQGHIYFFLLNTSSQPTPFANAIPSLRHGVQGASAAQPRKTAPSGDGNRRGGPTAPKSRGKRAPPQAVMHRQTFFFKRHRLIDKNKHRQTFGRKKHDSI